ncbi:MAG TPA: hypothetical protein VMV54_08955 [Acidocella sp.]|nr:hypothetical protein [Acidocella sp.]
MASRSICEQIQCGILSAPADVSYETLFECAAAGFVGVRACTDPVCQQYGGCEALDFTPVYVPIPPGAQAPPVEEGTGFDPWYGAEPYAPAEAADYPAATTPAPPPGEEEEDDEWPGLLIGSPEYSFNDGSAAGGQVQTIIERITSTVKEFPWWLWLLIAGAFVVSQEKT